MVRNDNFRIVNCSFSLLQSLVAIGALFGGIIGGKAVALIGRKFTIIIGSIPFALGWLLIFLAKNRAMLYAGRIFTGVGCGIETLAVAVSYHIYQRISVSHSPLRASTSVVAISGITEILNLGLR